MNETLVCIDCGASYPENHESGGYAVHGNRAYPLCDECGFYLVLQAELSPEPC